jgi:hypothetical protein
MTNRIRRSPAQWQHLVEQQAHSGLNAAAFCRQQGLCRKSFYHYRKVSNGRSTQLVTGRFIQVKAKPEPVLAPAMVVLDYRQARLQLPTGIDPIWVADLMKALS